MIVSAEDNLQSSLLSSSLTTVSFLTAEERLRYDATVTGNEVQLFTDTRHYESECNSQPFSLEDILSEIGLAINDVHSEIDSDISWPTFINTSIARPKTIIPIASLERLHAATPPKNPEKFRKMCDSIDSTGVYLYSTFTKREIIEALAEERELAFECRQFPRSSGYSEDPATGIAAGALASSLHKRKIMRYKSESWGSGNYDIFQGTAMGRPSKIHVRIGESEETNSYPSLKVTYIGVVAFDAVAFSDLAIET
ncbi:hypothetical protein ACHAW5_003712 [Stephanodiscus triporus]|uniref:Uncharacterized protein n=1 Tax=Stephanodiscus triporus TaxID=2934178 RepID=A0ABD3QI59_9STRA